LKIARFEVCKRVCEDNGSICRGKMEDMMSVVHISRTRKHTESVVKFYIYKATKNGTQMTKMRYYRRHILCLVFEHYTTNPTTGVN
jgi:hypothetical protein